MIEFRHRTDLLNAEAICFLFRLTNFGFRQLRKVADFPEPSHFRMVASEVRYGPPRKVVYWRRPVVDEYMEQVRLKALVASRRRRKK